MSDLTQKRGCQISALMEGQKNIYNKTLPNPSWIISIKDYGLYQFIGNLMLGEGPLKGRFYADVGDVGIPPFLFSVFLFFGHFLEHGVCREVACTQLRVLTYGPAHLVCTVRRSSCSVVRVRARHLEGMNHPSGFGVPYGGGILQLQLFSRSRFPTQAGGL